MVTVACTQEAGDEVLWEVSPGLRSRRAPARPPPPGLTEWALATELVVAAGSLRVLVRACRAFQHESLHDFFMVILKALKTILQGLGS